MPDSGHHGYPDPNKLCHSGTRDIYLLPAQMTV
jgi:hypothetical protein